MLFCNLLELVTYGTLLGLVGLVPGLHFGLVLLVGGPIVLTKLGTTAGLLAMVWAFGVSRAGRCLAVVYHPVSGENLASASPAQRLAHSGQGLLATQTMMRGVILGAFVSAWLLLLIYLGFDYLDLDFRKVLFNLLNWTLYPCLAIWVVWTLIRANNTFGTLLVLISTGVLGWYSLEHPALKGYEHNMTSLLAGIFAIPISILGILGSTSKSNITYNTLNQRPAKAYLGVIGLVSGLYAICLPGLGASSICSMAEGETETDTDYLYLTTTAETIDGCIALLWGVLLLAQRSAEASTISKVIGKYSVNPGFSYQVGLVMLLGVLVGAVLINFIGPSYRWLVNIIPLKLQALGVMLASLWVVWHYCGVAGLVVASLGTLIHLGGRWLGVPNQAFFGCIVGPMVMRSLLVL